MKNLLFIFLLALSSFSYAQQWAPVGATWTYSKSNYPFISPFKLQSIKDTIINTKNCRGIGTIGNNKLVHLYAENNQIFQFNDSLKQFTLLYDFNKKVGETWNVITNPSNSAGLLDTFSVVVDSTAFIVINGDSLKVQYITAKDTPLNYSVWDFSGMAIEKIGLVDYLFPKYGLVDFQPGGLRCYEDSNIHYNRTSMSCDTSYVLGSEDENYLNSRISIYPTPCENYFKIKFTDFNKSSYRFTLYNVMGDKIQEGNSISEHEVAINTENLSKGMYFLIINYNDNCFTKKIIKS